MVERNRDSCVGVKVRMGNLVPLVGALRSNRCVVRGKAADECELPLMMHISFGPSDDRVRCWLFLEPG